MVDGEQDQPRYFADIKSVMDGILGSENQPSSVSSDKPNDGKNLSDFEVKIAPDETNGVPFTSEKQNTAAEDELHAAAAENNDER